MTETIDAWARNYLESTCLDVKRQPSALPRTWLAAPAPLDLRPGRPACLQVTRHQPRQAKLSELASVEARAQLIHKFWHHELQAAELMAWACLRFPEAPQTFRSGLLGILHDEVRHMRMYESYLREAGFQVGDFPVRDAFWDRIPACNTPLAFVSAMGMGLEGANLEHTQRFAQRFAEVGDDKGARLHEQVGREEIAHVRFATRWFREFAGMLDFQSWLQALPPGFKPTFLRGKKLHWAARRKAEMPEEFLRELERCF